MPGSLMAKPCINGQSHLPFSLKWKGGNEQMLNLFPMVVLLNDHKLGGLKPQKFILSHIQRLNIQNQAHSWVVIGLCYLQRLYWRILTLPTAGGCQDSLACGHIIAVFKASIFKSLSTPSFCLLFCVKWPSASFWGYLRPTYIIQIITLMLRSLA